MQDIATIFNLTLQRCAILTNIKTFQFMCLHHVQPIVYPATVAAAGLRYHWIHPKKFNLSVVVFNT